MVPEWQRDQEYANVKDKLNGLVYDYFRLTQSERVLVQDTVQFVATSIQPPGYQRLSTPLPHRPSKLEIKEYVGALSKELGAWRAQDKGKGSLIVRAYVDGACGFFGAVQVRAERGLNDSAELVTSESAFKKLLEHLHASLAAHSADIDHDDLFKILNIMVFAGGLHPLYKAAPPSFLAATYCTHRRRPHREDCTCGRVGQGLFMTAPPPDVWFEVFPGPRMTLPPEMPSI